MLKVQHIKQTDHIMEHRNPKCRGITIRLGLFMICKEQFQLDWLINFKMSGIVWWPKEGPMDQQR